eukprot:COSAG02_NODE_3487_length_6663_cov_140.759293_1_plen_79_part_00
MTSKNTFHSFCFHLFDLDSISSYLDLDYTHREFRTIQSARVLISPARGLSCCGPPDISGFLQRIVDNNSIDSYPSMPD